MSKTIISGLLRKELGFTGIVIADDMSMGAIKREFSLSVALEKSINAGVDLFIVGNHLGSETEVYLNTIASLVHTGKVSAQRIDDAYHRIESAKRNLRDIGPKL